MQQANINRIIRLRINSDGEGVRSVVFVHGCPLGCVWCCNPENRMTGGFKALAPFELYSCISKDKPYFIHSNGAVTFSGGEPLLYADYIKEFITTYCTAFSVNMETSLYADVKCLEELYPLIGEWYIDFKVFDERKHIEYTGVPNERIKENLRFLARKVDPARIVITYPLIPGYNLSADNVCEMMNFLSDAGIHRIELHPYRKMSERKHRAFGLTPAAVPKLTPEAYGEIWHAFAGAGFELVHREAYQEKAKCRYLKDIRRAICREKGIPLNIMECPQERCIGTCPQCEHELALIGANWDQ